MRQDLMESLLSGVDMDRKIKESIQKDNGQADYDDQKNDDKVTDNDSLQLWWTEKHLK